LLFFIFILVFPFFSMMEQSSTLFDKRDAKFLRRLEDGAVVLTTAGSGNVFGSRASGAEDIVNEWEL
jgi:preprotein translocase subunit YajC